MSKRDSRVGTAVCAAVLFGALFLLCRQFPLTGDDWFREALGASIHSPADLLRIVAARWATVNGRVLGNILAYTAGSRPLLRELMRALFLLALAELLAWTAQLRGWRGLLLCTAAVLALPQAMFCQIYPWAAGFFNYVPPVVLLLASLVLAGPVLDGRPMEESPQRGAALFLLGFGQQLFVENNTLYALCASMALLVWYWLERRRCAPALLAFFLGCALGAALLFASPSYRSIGQTGGAYQSSLGGGLAGLLASARVNLPPVLQYLILDCPVLYWGLTALALLLWLKNRRGLPDHLLAAVLALSCLVLAWGGFRPAVTAAVWGLALTLALWRWVPERPARARALFLWLGAPVAAAPLLFVNPIGPRCLFLSYVLMLAAAGVLVRALEPEQLNGWLSGLVPAALAAAVLCFFLSVYQPFHQVEELRTQALNRALASRASAVSLPAYDHGGWLWDADSAFKMEQYYYRKTPGDLTITFVPGAQWEG